MVFKLLDISFCSDENLLFEAVEFDVFEAVKFFLDELSNKIKLGDCTKGFLSLNSSSGARLEFGVGSNFIPVIYIEPEGSCHFSRGNLSNEDEMEFILNYYKEAPIGAKMFKFDSKTTSEEILSKLENEDACLCSFFMREEYPENFSMDDLVKYPTLLEIISFFMDTSGRYPNINWGWNL